ncbi:hypothetical protein ACFW91_12775 [Streptomyces asoensis]|uniref:hypothetical protein n=1 Tax=Streptomyces asoensis TaxID=249586 RepID=UPI0036B92A1E
MPNWLIALLVAVVTALATTLVSSVTILPRLEARNRKIQAGHQDRERFGQAVLTVLTCSARLTNLVIPDDASPVVREALIGEGERWRQKIDAATKDLADSIAPLSYIWFLKDVALRFALVSRLVWISERSESAKLSVLLELSGSVQGLFFAAWWRRPKRAKCMRHLVQIMDDLQADRR